MNATQMHERIRLDARPKLTQCCKEGYWFCLRCGRVVNLGLDNDSPARCPRCEHQTAVWMPPVI
jgi:DNA-directed RNA polymerase subunit RPC12/RpoP